MMRIAVQFGRMSLAFRKTLDLATHRTDPRGLTGSELGCIRIAQCLRDLGHTVSLHTIANEVGQTWEGITVKHLDEAIEPCDAVIAINEPDMLRAAPAGAFRCVMYWLNDTSFCKVGFDQHVDLFCSPSDAHRQKMLSSPEWHAVEKTPEHPNGKATYVPDPAKWAAVRLGCDPERYKFTPQNDPGWAGQVGKIPGRVVYCSSPDRGLHHTLQVWPEIRRAVPHATLHVFYRLEPWLRGFDNTPFFPPIEPLRDRAMYAEECLRRFKERGGMGVTLRDSVSRETIEREMAQAEVLAYHCDTTTWSEGFSCTILEACAARACPIITDCDALGEVYGGVCGMAPVGDVKLWRDMVIAALRDETIRNAANARCEKFAAEHTWKRTAERIMEEINARRA